LLGEERLYGDRVAQVRLRRGAGDQVCEASVEEVPQHGAAHEAAMARNVCASGPIK
jgi:hypothetical protein